VGNREIQGEILQNRALWGIFGPKKEEVRREWRRLHNEELYYLKSALNIFRAIKSGKMRWARYVARMGRETDAWRVLMGET
jgi:hypothetical protein